MRNVIESKEFHSIDELHRVKESLATARQIPVYIHPGESYDELENRQNKLQPRRVDDEVVEMRDRSALWNERDNKVEYISSDQYELVQHSDVLDIVQDTVERSTGEIDMGVIRDYGAQIDGTLVFSNLENAKINVEDIVDTDGYIPPETQVDPRGNSRARDVLGLGMRIGNSFDGTKQVYASTMGYRFICQNWMVWGEETIAHVQKAHIGDIDEEFFESVIEEVFEIRDEVSTRVRDGESEEFPLEWIPEVLEAAGYGPTYAKRITGRALTQSTPRRGYTTQWRLYNAATSELDNRRVDDISKPAYDKHQESAWNILDGDVPSPSETWDMEEVEEFAIIK